MLPGAGCRQMKPAPLLLFALCFSRSTIWFREYRPNACRSNVFSHLKANPENKQYVIATYFHLRTEDRFSMGKGFLISIEMNMMADNEYMPLDASQSAQMINISSKGGRRRRKKGRTKWRKKSVQSGCVNISIEGEEGRIPLKTLRAAENKGQSQGHR